jgi:hypothetical protein
MYPAAFLYDSNVLLVLNEDIYMGMLLLLTVFIIILFKLYIYCVPYYRFQSLHIFNILYQIYINVTLFVYFFSTVSRKLGTE